MMKYECMYFYMDFFFILKLPLLSELISFLANGIYIILIFFSWKTLGVKDI